MWDERPTVVLHAAHIRLLQHTRTVLALTCQRVGPAQEVTQHQPHVRRAEHGRLHTQTLKQSHSPSQCKELFLPILILIKSLNPQFRFYQIMPDENITLEIMRWSLVCYMCLPAFTDGNDMTVNWPPHFLHWQTGGVEDRILNTVPETKTRLSVWHRLSSHYTQHLPYCTAAYESPMLPLGCLYIYIKYLLISL